MFKSYSPIEYLCIDIANCFGHDKWLFEDRIQWVKENHKDLEQLADQADDNPLYLKAVMALRDVQAGKPTGHLVALDATCSGIQIMSAITGCVNGAEATGLVNPNKRADAYTQVTQEMNKILTANGQTSIEVSRNDVKRAVMTCGYGSTMVPKEVFGEGEMLAVFYRACFNVAGGAFELMNDLLGTWQSGALSHNWVMPDNFHVNIKVMQSKETRVEVDELGHTTFTTHVKINQGSKHGLANVANTIHSIDAYLLRSVIRRAAFIPAKVEDARNLITAELVSRSINITGMNVLNEELENMLNIYAYSDMVDVRIIDYLTQENIGCVPVGLLTKLNKTLAKMQELGSSPVLTVHDAFRAHPNHCDTVRYWYKELMAELAESNMLVFIVGQIINQPIVYKKKSTNLPTLIRNSNYAIS